MEKEVIKVGEKGHIVFMCPGCESVHQIYVPHPERQGITWDWNGSKTKPTFSPSIKVTLNLPKGDKICHTFVNDGKIQYLSDCTHKLAGQTVDLPEVPEAYRT